MIAWTFTCTCTLEDQASTESMHVFTAEIRIRGVHCMMCCFEVCAHGTLQTLQANWVISADVLLNGNVVVW